MNSSEISNQERLVLLRRSISDLNDLSKRLLSSEEFDVLEDNWLQHPNWDHTSYWRGADIQVIQSYVGDTIKVWKNHPDLNSGSYSTDTPCPSRFPNFLSGLILEIQVYQFSLTFSLRLAFL